MSGSAERSPDVIVVGAGIVGCACADRLTACGMTVDLIDAAFPGGGTTSCAMGHVVTMDDSEPQFALTDLGRRLWSEWTSDLPPSIEAEHPGTLWIAADDEELAGAAKRCDYYRSRGVDAEMLDPVRLLAMEPMLRKGLAGALHVRDDGLVYPPVAARELLARSLRRRSADGTHLCRFIGDVKVVEIARGAVEEASGRRRSCGAVVLAAGASSTKFLPGLAITPRRGHLMITDRYPGFLRHPLVELGYLKSAHSFSPESIAFNLQPRRSGQMLLGSSREFVGFDPLPNRRLMSRMVARAIEFCPALEKVSVIRTWVGFRPCTPDNLPLIGKWADGIYVAAGHEGLGITTAPATGRLIADLLTGREPAIPIAPFAPTRKFEAAHV